MIPSDEELKKVGDVSRLFQIAPLPPPHGAPVERVLPDAA
jgi:hypothetical protein